MAESAGVSCPLPSEQDNVEQAKGNPALDSSTFIPPLPLASPSITIEFCDRCRWLHRATWVSTELFLTFPPPALKAISIIPLNSEETGGRFRVWLNLEDSPPQLMWDRKIEGGFPELKDLKQRIRDHVQPGKSLGHSDKKSE
ncbi:hypothetical protein BDR05DRAFT_372663 [Suillus weaverae]|nr:hypothetical protein BDR05DRAFT_372663 [Suillus weaverae]